MASLLSPEIAQTVKNGILEPLNGPPGNAYSAALWALVALFGLINVLYATLLVRLGLRMWRRQDHFWLVKRVNRGNGRYFLPNGSQLFLFGFSTFSILYFGWLIELALRRRNQRVPHTAGTIVQALYPTCLVVGVWPVIVSQVVSVAFSLEAKSPKFASRLPRPLILNLWTWGYFAILFGAFFGFGIFYAVAAVPFFADLAVVLSLLDKAIAGTLSDQEFAQLFKLQETTSARVLVFIDAYKKWSWVAVAFGFSLVLMYLPCAIALLHQLYGNQRSLARHAKFAPNQSDTQRSLAPSLPSLRFSRTLQNRRDNYNPMRYLAVRVTLIACYAGTAIPLALVLILSASGSGPAGSFSRVGGLIIGFIHGAFDLCFAAAALVQSVLEIGQHEKSLENSSGQPKSTVHLQSLPTKDSEMDDLSIIDVQLSGKAKIAVNEADLVNISAEC